MNMRFLVLQNSVKLPLINDGKYTEKYLAWAEIGRNFQTAVVVIKVKNKENEMLFPHFSLTWKRLLINK